MEKIALLPGGFKPPHAGHYNMAKWLAANTDADTIVIKVGSKERDGITREMSLKLWNLYRLTDPDSPKLAILASEKNSPVADVYDFIEQDAPEGSKIYLGAGEKDKEDSRYNNIYKFADPKNIEFEIVLVPPQAGGVSGTEMRSFINNDNKESFQNYLPEHLTPEQKDKAWSIVSSIQEDLYNPEDKVLNYMRSSEYKAGMPDGPKKDIPRTKNQIHNRQRNPHAHMSENKLNENSTAAVNGQFIPLEIMDTPESQVQGMMGRDKLKGGMVFPYDGVAKRDFHTKNCKIPLDIVFIIDNTINLVHHNCPPCYENRCPKYSGTADNVLELPGGYCKKHNINKGDDIGLSIYNMPKPIEERKYGGHDLISQYKKQIQTKYGHQQYRNLQTLVAQNKDEEAENWILKAKKSGKLKDPKDLPSIPKFTKPSFRGKAVSEASTFSKDWWSNIIKEMLLVEGGAAGHMAHPFNLPNVNSGKDLLDVFNKTAESLEKDPGSVKIDGVNSSIRLIDLDGKKQFVMDRGSKKELDIKGITKDDLLNRFGDGHGMVKIGGEVLDMFNKALPSIKSDLEKLGAWDDPNILFNMEYVSGKTNVQDYGSNFIAIHGLNKIESKEVQGKRKMLIKRISSEISYDKSDLQSLLDNLTPTAKEKGFEVYGSVPTEMTKKPNFNSALSKRYTIEAGENTQTKSLKDLLSELNNIPEEDFIFMNVDGSKKKVGAVSKQVYLAILNKENVEGLFDDEDDKQKAIEGFTTYLATEKLGDEILKVLDSPMGSVENHEGVVIRDENIASMPFKITGKFILGGMVSDF